MRVGSFTPFSFSYSAQQISYWHMPIAKNPASIMVSRLINYIIWRQLMEKKIAAFDNDEVRRLTWMMIGFFTPIVVSVFIPIWWIRAILVIPLTAFMLYSIWYAWFKDPEIVRSDKCANLVIFGERPDNCKETPKSPNGFKFGDF